MKPALPQIGLALQAVSSVLGGWFIGIYIFICVFTVFMAVCNCIAYYNIATADDNPQISVPFAWTLFVLNILLAILAILGFFYILLRWTKYTDMKNKYMEFNTENVVKSTFDKGVNPAIQQIKNAYPGTLNQNPDILLLNGGMSTNQPNPYNYTAYELQKMTNAVQNQIVLETPIMETSTERFQPNIY